MAVSAAIMVPHPLLIVPDIGKGAEKIGDLKPDTIVVISPHQIMYADYFHISPGRSAAGDFGQFGADRIKIWIMGPWCRCILSISL